MNTESSHLDLAELLAEVNGETADDRAWAHLATCPACRAEAERWGAVADGVRHVVAATPAPARLPGTLAGAGRPQPAALPHGRMRAPAGRKQRGMLVAAAAAAVAVAGATSYGLTAARGSSGSAGNTAAMATGLIAVRGCPGLEGTSGTLEQVNGTGLVLKSLSGGQQVTVTTSASTTLSTQVRGAVSDITDGSRVIVHGTGAGGVLAAQTLSLGVGPGDAKGVKVHVPPQDVGNIAGGIVADADASVGSFTVLGPAGTRTPVTTSSSTTIYTLVSASLSQLQDGGIITSVGSAGPNGTLAAATVDEGTYQPRIFSPDGSIARLPGGSCSPSAIAATAFMTGG
jgi:hypothetical protein